MLKKILKILPVKYYRMLVYQAPISVDQINTFIDIDILIKEISFDDIDNDPWLNEKNKRFRKYIAEGYYGLIALNKINNECVAYTWFSINNPPPTNIVKIPLNSAWVFNTYVKKEHRNKGIQKYLAQVRQKIIQQRFNITNIFTDISPNNIVMHENMLKLNYTPMGVYHIIKIGYKSLKPLYIPIGIWDKTKQHPFINRNK